MEKETETEQELLRYHAREYTAQESQRILGELESFEQTKLYNLFLWDLQIEIAQLRDDLEETESLSDEQVHMLRGEIRKAKQLSKRFAEIGMHLLRVEENRTKENDE